MALRDAAIVGYAETKIVEKETRDIWEMGAEILENLLDKTGFEKKEIDGLILSSSMTGAGNPFWSQTTADQLALELDFCQTVDIGGCSPTARWRAHARQSMPDSPPPCCVFTPTARHRRATASGAAQSASGRCRLAISARRRHSDF